MAPVTPNAFANAEMNKALDAMRQRLATIEPLITEAAGLKKAIAAQEAALLKVPAVAAPAPRRELGAGEKLPTGAVPPPVPSAPRPAAALGGGGRPADPELGTVKVQLYKLLAHPEAQRGVSAAVLCRAVRGAQTNSVTAQLSELARDEGEGIDKIGRGFYRLKRGWTVDEDGRAHPPAA